MPDARRALGADRARFVEIDEDAGEFVTLGGHAVGGMPGGYGRYPLDAYAPLARAIRAGRRLAIDDTQRDEYLRSIRGPLAKLQIGAQLVLPRAGRRCEGRPRRPPENSASLDTGAHRHRRRIIYVNPAIEEMLGYPPGSLAGQPTEVIYVEPADRAWVTRLDEVGPRGKRVGQLKRRDGSLV